MGFGKALHRMTPPRSKKERKKCFFKRIALYELTICFHSIHLPTLPNTRRFVSFNTRQLTFAFQIDSAVTAANWGRLLMSVNSLWGGSLRDLLLQKLL